jgi:streptogramin lyase
MKTIEDWVIWALIAGSALLFLYLFGFPADARAQALNCARFDAIHVLVTKTYHQADIGGGQLNPTTALRVYSAPDGAAFSMVVVRASGEACIVATGTGLDLSPPKKSSEREG